MKKLLTLIALSTLLIHASLTASPYSYSGGDSRDGFYISAITGAGIPTDGDMDSTNLTPNINGEVKHDVGFGIAAAIGYSWNNFRFELEYAYRQNDGDFQNANIAGIPVVGLNGTSADLDFHGVMFNVLYDLYLTNDLYWYNGGGIGVSFIKAKTSSALLLNNNDSQTEFAWQIMTGLGYNLTENIALTLGYRLFSTTDPEFDFGNAKIEVETPFINSIEAGVRFNF